MNEKQFSIIGFCHNWLFSRRKTSAKKRRNFEEISAKKILEELIWWRNKPRREREYEELKDLSRSTPNLVYCQVSGNLTMKPTISIKRKNAENPFQKSFGTFRPSNSCGLVQPRNNLGHKLDLSLDTRQQQSYSNVYRKLSLKTSKTKTRQKSFKQNITLISENLNSTKIKNFNSCPNLNQISLEEKLDHGREKIFENVFYDDIDNVDDFTTNLFLNVIPDENDLDLISIHFDLQ